MRLLKKASKKLLSLLLVIIMLMSILPLGMAGAVNRLPNVPAPRNPSPGSGSGGQISIQPLSFDKDNPTDRIISMFSGETEYRVDTRPGIAGTTKYLYTDPSFDEQYLIGIANCPTDNTLNIQWESQNAAIYPVTIEAGGTPVYLWAKYVENYPYSPTTMYYRLILIPPPVGEIIYMDSMAGQNVFPPEVGSGSTSDPYTATIYVPLTKTTIENPDSWNPATGDIKMTGEGRRYLFLGSSFTTMDTFVPLVVGENHVYSAISSLSTQIAMYYDITVFRGYPFQKNADRLFYEAGDTLNYTVDWLIPEPFDFASNVRIVDEYDPSKVSFAGVSSLTITATLNGVTETLNPLNDYLVQNDSATGTLTITFYPSGKLKMAVGTIMEMNVSFNVLSDTTGTIVNNAKLYYATDVFGEDEARVYEKDFEKTAEPGTFTQDGDEILYTISFTMPDELSDFDAVRIVDVLPASGLAYKNQAELFTSTGSAFIPMLSSGNTLYYEFIGSELAGLAGEEITIALLFEVSNWTGGAIKNTAEIYFRPAGGNYPTTPDADDEETIYPLDVTDFSKDAALGTYVPGEKIDYTVSWTLPSTASGIKALRVIDTYDATKVTYGGSLAIYVGGTALVNLVDYNSTNDPLAGTLTTVLTPAGIAKLADDTLIELKVTFNVLPTATGDIENNAKLFYNASTDPDGEDDEIVTENDFEKDVKLSNYAPGSRVDYIISATLPSGIENRKVLEIVDTYPAAYLSFVQVDSFTIGGVALTASQYSLIQGNGTVTVRINVDTLGHYNFTLDAGKALVLNLRFVATADAQGVITNEAEISYDLDIGGEGTTTIDENEFSKDAAAKKYIPGGTIDYTVSWLLPDDVSAITALRVVDNYNATLVSYSSVKSLSVGGTALTPVTDYLITNNPAAGTLTINLTAAGLLKLVNDALVEIEVEFNVALTALDPIINNAQMFYNSNTEPDGEDDEEVVLAVGPPTEVEQLPGDRKTALLWADPAGDAVVEYQIKIDDFAWMTFDLQDLTFDSSSGTNGRWYILFENLPNGIRLVNGVPYTFQIRAVTAEGLIGPPFQIISTPGELGDIGGRNTDLLRIYTEDVMPVSGWPNDGTGLSAANPHEATIILPANFMYIVIHRNFVFVGEDATFEMYSDSSFTNEIVIIDRLDNSFNWINSLNLYIKVTSGNLQLVRYYNIEITT
ncbi:MAG: isopeptide-forming domain-containing fimbrial protein [Oscillospiraceae bacterium]|nr:isopeptide-forming domain-containing fimbrial protein [Oscillospiraceae bacterium]